MILDLDKVPDIKYFGTSGSGHQIKTWIVKDGCDYLIKLNSKFREASKEESVSKFLDIIGIEHVQYKSYDFRYKGEKHRGSICKSYINKANGEEAYPIYNIISDLDIGKNWSTRDYYEAYADLVEHRLGFSRSYIDKYMFTLLTIDFIVMNPDRHFSNIEIIEDKNGNIRFSPLFDFGQSFLKRDSQITISQFRGQAQKFKMLPFSNNQFKNLINLQFSKDFAKLIKSKILPNTLNKLDIPDFHKFVIKNRVETLVTI